MKWLSYQHGFGTYFHLIEGYFSKQTCQESMKVLEQLIRTQKEAGSTLYIDTMISPSYTSAIAQVIQSPSISGMENNMVMFEYDKGKPEELARILSNVNLVHAGNFDVCILASSDHVIRCRDGIHVWISDTDDKNTNFMILLGYIIMAHPDWKRSHIKIFIPSKKGDLTHVKENLAERIEAGRLPITFANIEIVSLAEGQTVNQAIAEHSKTAGLTIMSFDEHIIKHESIHHFTGYDEIGDILFVNAGIEKEIN